MIRSLTVIAIVLGLLGCNTNRIAKSDIDKLIDSKLKSTEEILMQLETFVKQHGKDGLEFQNKIAADFLKTHQSVLSFLDSLERFERRNMHIAANDFIDKTFYKYTLTYPYDATITENTPLELIKFQILDIENLLVREWQENVRHRFNNIGTTIIPDKVGFCPKEKITGTIGFMAYSNDMKPKMKLNGKDIEVRDGKGYFTVDQKDLLPGQKSLTAEVIFPDTIYRTSISVQICD